MGVGADVYMYDVVVKNSRSLSHLLMSSCLLVFHCICAILYNFRDIVTHLRKRKELTLA